MQKKILQAFWEIKKALFLGFFKRIYDHNDSKNYGVNFERREKHYIENVVFAEMMCGTSWESVGKLLLQSEKSLSKKAER